MSTINNQALYAIDTVEDIARDISAAVCGGIHDKKLPYLVLIH
ncbi:MAG TPA: hypothetical protein V6D10_10160 [Trichocoleus sp.]|jgi:hypothetical protein